MGIKVKAIERNIAFNKDAKKAHFAYVMQAEMYAQLAQDKVIAQAALNSGMPKPAMKAAIDAYGEVVKVWVTEGHSIPIPGLGSMRFGLRSVAVDDVKNVSASLITSRHVIFTPSVEIKKELAETPVTITCYDRNGNLVKTVTSGDKDDVEGDNNKDDKGDTSDPDKGSTDAGGSQGGSSSGTGSAGDGGGQFE